MLTNAASSGNYPMENSKRTSRRDTKRIKVAEIRIGSAEHADHPRGSVSKWIAGVREGDDLAAQELWNRYFAQLIGIALRRLGSRTRRESAEDIALSALKTVMIGLQKGQFPELNDRLGLW